MPLQHDNCSIKKSPAGSKDSSYGCISYLVRTTQKKGNTDRYVEQMNKNNEENKDIGTISDRMF
jgi:hypothetical protein